MGTRWVVGIVAVLVAVTMGGIGFAAFTSSVNLSVSANAGTVALEWACISGPYACDTSAVNVFNPGIASSSYMTCEFEETNSGFGFLVQATNMAPGDTCMVPAGFGQVLANFGSLPATLSLAFASQTGSCGQFTFSDNLFFAPTVTDPFTYTIPIGSHGAYVPAGGYSATLSLPSGVGNSCQGQTDTASWTITATAGT